MSSAAWREAERSVVEGVWHGSTQSAGSDLDAVAIPPSQAMARGVRSLCADMVTAAGSGDAAFALAMADVATALFGRVLRYEAADPAWPDRDRFVLSAGHGAALLYALLHLSGYEGMDEAALRGFRTMESPAAGRPEPGEHPGIELTTGPAGQGFAMAVGLALAERAMAARFGRSLVDHRTWVMACADEMMDGVTLEAAALAGLWKLERLTVLIGVPVDAPADGEDTLRRLAAQGWGTKLIDGHDPAAIGAALSFAARARKPTAIGCRVTVRPAPAREEAFAVSPGTRARWLAAGARGVSARRGWLKRLARHPMRAEFERVVAGRSPEGWHDTIGAIRVASAVAADEEPTEMSAMRCLEALAAAVPELVGGAATAAGTAPLPCGLSPITASGFGGRYAAFGARAHGMAACLAGMARHGGLLPFGVTSVARTDALRPALRLSALMRARVVYLLTNDGIGVGEDGPTRQPIEQLASLRAMPDLHVFRPADATETAECWELAMRRADGPSLLVLSRQTVPSLRADTAENRCVRGGYVIAEAEGARRATLIATGSEVSVALAARAALAEEGIAVAVVSLPCWELFAATDPEYRAAVLGGAPRIGIEAGCALGWERWLGAEGVFIGMTTFGASAPADALYRFFGLTADAVAAAVRTRVGL